MQTECIWFFIFTHYPLTFPQNPLHHKFADKSEFYNEIKE